jgi:hypothetical protein
MFSLGVIILEMVTGRGIYYDWHDGKMSENGLSYVSTTSSMEVVKLLIQTLA